MTTIRQNLDRLTAAATEAGDPERTRHIAFGPQVLGQVPGWLAAARPGQRPLIVCDANTRRAAGAELERRLAEASFEPTSYVLEPLDGEDHVVCEQQMVDALAAVLAADARLYAVAVGAGTVNDTAKMAAKKVGRPYLVVPTAASMNGYTSAIAAVLVKGVKRTLSAQQPEAIFADLDVLRAAPAFLTQAGFGDLLSKPFSNADWRLAHRVRGVPYDKGPAQLLDAAYLELLEHAGGIGRAEPEAVSLLGETLLLSGFTMALAGTSAPASGGEHLVSHYWDMEQHCQEQPLHGLHGTQVGIGTLLSAQLHERLLTLDGDAFDPAAAVRHQRESDWLSRLETVHPLLTAEVVDEVREQLAAKQRTGDSLAEEIAHVRAIWPSLKRDLEEVLLPANRIWQALKSAGCAASPGAIGVGREHALRTLVVCRHIRNRYCALDLLDDIGLLQGWAAEVLAQVEEGHV